MYFHDQLMTSQFCTHNLIATVTSSVVTIHAFHECGDKVLCDSMDCDTGRMIIEEDKSISLSRIYAHSIKLDLYSLIIKSSI